MQEYASYDSGPPSQMHGLSPLGAKINTIVPDISFSEPEKSP